MCVERQRKFRWNGVGGTIVTWVLVSVVLTRSALLTPSTRP